MGGCCLGEGETACLLDLICETGSAPTAVIDVAGSKGRTPMCGTRARPTPRFPADPPGAIVQEISLVTALLAGLKNVGAPLWPTPI
jgi:hypothetical protein